MIELVVPAPSHLASHVDALRRGWSPNTLRPEAAAEELAHYEADPAGFLGRQDDPDGRLPPVVLPDGTTRPRLPSLTRWMWDGEFCGLINARWQPGRAELPPYVLGHVGYTVVPWKQGNGHATRALGLLLPELQGRGLPWIELTTDEDNIASQKVIERNGGERIERIQYGPEYGGGLGFRYRITLAQAPIEPQAPMEW